MVTKRQRLISSPQTAHRRIAEALSDGDLGRFIVPAGIRGRPRRRRSSLPSHYVVGRGVTVTVPFTGQRTHS
jgi:hypothetical protein